MTSTWLAEQKKKDEERQALTLAIKFVTRCIEQGAVATFSGGPAREYDAARGAMKIIKRNGYLVQELAGNRRWWIPTDAGRQFVADAHADR